MEDNRLAKDLRDPFAAADVPLEEFYRHTLEFQQLGHPNAYLFAPHNIDAIQGLLSLKPHELAYGLQFFGRGDNVDMVSRIQNLGSMRNNDLLPPEDQGDQRILGRAGPIQILHRLVRDPALLLDIHSKKFYPAFGKIDHVGDAGQAHHPQDAIGNLGFGVNDQVDVQSGFLEYPPPVVDFVRTDPRHLELHIRFHRSNQTNQHVDLIFTGQRNQHIGCANIRLMQDTYAGGVAMNHLGVQHFLQLMAALQALLNQHHLVTLANQARGNERSGLSAAGNQDPHGLEGCLCKITSNEKSLWLEWSTAIRYWKVMLLPEYILRNASKECQGLSAEANPATRLPGHGGVVSPQIEML